jgi:hypothetical protein
VNAHTKAWSAQVDAAAGAMLDELVRVEAALRVLRTPVAA